MTLIEQLEAATEPSRELDAEISITIGEMTPKQVQEWREHIDILHFPEVDVQEPEYWTSSIDAAMTLLPEGWVWAMANNFHAPGYVVGLHRKTPFAAAEGESGVPAIAICIAALKAKEAKP